MKYVAVVGYPDGNIDLDQFPLGRIFPVDPHGAYTNSLGLQSIVYEPGINSILIQNRLYLYAVIEI